MLTFAQPPADESAKLVVSHASATVERNRAPVQQQQDLISQVEVEDGLRHYYTPCALQSTAREYIDRSADEIEQTSRVCRAPILIRTMTVFDGDCASISST
jgi:hypothetical protein